MVSLLFTILIILNTVVLAMDRYPISPELTEQYDVLNFSFGVAFLMEMLLKLLGLGLGGYFKTNFNRFDFVVVMFSIVEVRSSCHHGTQGLGGVLNTRE